jgi:hypothetical protein
MLYSMEVMVVLEVLPWKCDVLLLCTASLVAAHDRMLAPDALGSCDVNTQCENAMT